MTTASLRIVATALCLGLPASPASARDDTIQLQDHTIDIIHVPTDFPGCSGEFGRQLAADLRDTRLQVAVSTNYDLRQSTGLAVVKMVLDGHVDDAAILDPLGSAGSYSFGNWWEARPLRIRGHIYALRGAVFRTTGSTVEQWGDNARARMFLVNPERSDFSCPVTSDPNWGAPTLTPTPNSGADPAARAD